MSDKIFEDLKNAVIDLNPDAAIVAAKAAMAANINPVDGIDKGLSEGMSVIVERFDEGELFMPQILIAAQAFQNACEILQSGISKEDIAKMSNGKVLFFSVAGDIHDIGKNIVKTMLMANNFEVKDLGRDVGSDTVIDVAIEWGADVVAGSALMTTTMPAQRDVINGLIERGVRDKFKVMFGGAPVTEAWCKEIGADAYGDNAADAVRIAKELVK
ncbi:methyltransferase cognate corrinoid protein [Dehalobacterium formicoaceticum]|uniref:Methyltransferase cognate corrinoid protein n=1 Tax=Dehalobacterium formicoaceticum TaxID=51515 RepID=A0ABT1Y2P2_9FIRM|nr:methyltransferase cognate corrinoid protein [Dehalobacterium formicoaceticum]MCR6545132.1 methyltransferase cognate corrinoid protein [Dehalobacterium formicoaceticum]